MGDGTYLWATPIWVYNLENDNYSAPLKLSKFREMENK